MQINSDKIVKTEKQNKNLVYNSDHSLVKVKDISDFQEITLDSMNKKLQNFH